MRLSFDLRKHIDFVIKSKEKKKKKEIKIKFRKKNKGKTDISLN